MCKVFKRVHTRMMLPRGKSKVTLKIGFIGTGWIANWHLEHLSTIEGTKIVSLCDVNKERVEAASKKWKAKSYTDYERMLPLLPLSLKVAWWEQFILPAFFLAVIR